MIKSAFISVVIACIFSACSKSGGQASLLVVEKIDDSLRMPLAIGNTWQYQRIDSTVINGPSFTAATVFATDVTTENFTVVAQTLVPSIDAVNPAWILEITNITKATKDTMYIVNTDNRFNVYGHNTSQVENFNAYTGTASVPSVVTDAAITKLIGISLPAKNSFFTPASIQTANPYSLDTVFVKKDTAVQLVSATYTGCVLMHRIHYAIAFSPSGSGSLDTDYFSFIKPDVGFVYIRQEPVSTRGSIFNQYTVGRWTTRRLTGYLLK